MSAPTPFSSFNAALALMHHTYFSPILGTLVQCGVPDHLDKGPLKAAELAELAGMDSLSLTRVLRAISAFGAFQEVSPGTFANTPISDLFRKRPGGLSNAALFYSSEQFLKSAEALGHSAVTGESATGHVFGMSIWDYLRQNPEENEKFNRGLAELRGDEHQQVAEAYDWSGVNTVVDVGGGVGSLLAAVLERRPSLQGVLIEQPELISDADRLLSARGVRQRCQLVAGSFFDPMSAVGEVWAMCQVLHDWADADCVKILRRCREALRQTDRLLILEMLTVPCKPSIPVAMVDMAMLMYFGEARQRTQEEYETLLALTHFAVTRVLPTAGMFSILEARPI
jgi:hypothetical protein